MPRRVATGVDPKRLAMIVAVLARHAGIPLGQADVFVNVAGGVRIDEPGADLAVALAIASAARRLPGPQPAPPPSARSASPGGSARPTQADRRLEECAKLGLAARRRPGRDAGAWHTAGHAGGDAAPGDQAGSTESSSMPNEPKEHEPERRA